MALPSGMAKKLIRASVVRPRTLAARRLAGRSGSPRQAVVLSAAHADGAAMVCIRK